MKELPMICGICGVEEVKGGIPGEETWYCLGYNHKQHIMVGAKGGWELHNGIKERCKTCKNLPNSPLGVAVDQ